MSEAVTPQIKRNVGLLAGCQALLLCNGVTLIAVNGLAGAKLAPTPTLATLTVTGYVIGTALMTLPASWFMKHYGRRAGMVTAVDLAGLTRVELGFALALAAAAAGLTLWLGLVERRRTFAIATALGATQRQLGAFVWAEAGVVTIAGLIAGTATAWALSNMLVKVLQGVFDPPPSVLAVPWTYLIVLGAITIAATIADAAALISARRPRMDLLRAN